MHVNEIVVAAVEDEGDAVVAGDACSVRGLVRVHVYPYCSPRAKRSMRVKRRVFACYVPRTMTSVSKVIGLQRVSRRFAMTLASRGLEPLHATVCVQRLVCALVPRVAPAALPPVRVRTCRHGGKCSQACGYVGVCRRVCVVRAHGVDVLLTRFSGFFAMTRKSEERKCGEKAMTLVSRGEKTPYTEYILLNILSARVSHGKAPHFRGIMPRVRHFAAGSLEVHRALPVGAAVQVRGLPTQSLVLRRGNIDSGRSDPL